MDALQSLLLPPYCVLSLPVPVVSVERHTYRRWGRCPRTSQQVQSTGENAHLTVSPPGGTCTYFGGENCLQAGLETDFIFVRGFLVGGAGEMGDS